MSLINSPIESTVFISYRRVDGSDFAKRLYEDLNKQGIKAWLDVENMPSGNTFIDEIDRAIERSDYFLLVATPEAINSDFCKDEWKKALEHYKPIIPIIPWIKDSKKIKYEDILPKEAFAHLNDARDFQDDDRYDEELIQLVKRINIPPDNPGTTKGVPKQFSYNVPRLELLKPLQHALTAHKTTVLTTSNPRVGVHGMGGIGKSTLGVALAHDYFIRRSFNDGIFWLSAGKNPDLPEIWATLATYLDGESHRFKKDEADKARDFFEEKTQSKKCLIILDDVWSSNHVKAFHRLGKGSRLFVTTRDASILKEINADSYPIGVMTKEQSQKLLSLTSGRDELPSQADGIIKACGNLPLALSMIGAMVKDKSDNYWQDAIDALHEADLTYIEGESLDYLHPNLFSALKVSIDALNTIGKGNLRENYYDFSIFLDGVSIPESLLLTLWMPLKPREIRSILAKLVARNLVIQKDTDDYTLHSLQLAYLSHEASQIETRHQRLLRQYDDQNWERWSQNETYIHEYFVHHLIGASKLDEAFSLFNTQDWMIRRFNINDYTYDGYISDIELLSHKLLTTEKSDNEEVIMKIFRLALIRSSINSLNTNYSPEILVKLLETELWTVERCIKVLSRNNNPNMRVIGATKLLESNKIEDDDIRTLETIGITAIKSETYSGERINLLKILVPQLEFKKRDSLFLWVQAASEISSNFYRTKALFELMEWVEESDTELGKEIQQVSNSIVPEYWGFYLLYSAIDNKIITDPDAFAKLEHIANQIPEEDFEQPILSHLKAAQTKIITQNMGLDFSEQRNNWTEMFDRLLMGEDAHQSQLSEMVNQLGFHQTDELKQVLKASLSINDEAIQLQVLSLLLKSAKFDNIPKLVHTLLDILQKALNNLDNIDSVKQSEFDAQITLAYTYLLPYLERAEQDVFIDTLCIDLEKSFYKLNRNIFGILTPLLNLTQSQKLLNILLQPPSIDIPRLWVDAISTVLDRIEELISDSNEMEIYISNAILRVENILHERQDKNLRLLALSHYLPKEQVEILVKNILPWITSAPILIENMPTIVIGTRIFQDFVKQILLPDNLNNEKTTETLSYLVPYLNEEQLDLVIQKVLTEQKSDNGAENLRLLANLQLRSQNNEEILKLSRSQLCNVFYITTVRDFERKTLLSLLTISNVIDAPILSQTVLQQMTQAILEICSEWEWL